MGAPVAKRVTQKLSRNIRMEAEDTHIQRLCEREESVTALGQSRFEIVRHVTESQQQLQQQQLPGQANVNRQSSASTRTSGNNYSEKNIQAQGPGSRSVSRMNGVSQGGLEMAATNGPGSTTLSVPKRISQFDINSLDDMLADQFRESVNMVPSNRLQNPLWSGGYYGIIVDLNLVIVLKSDY